MGLNLEWGPTNRIASMLLAGNGLLDPKAHYFHRVLMNWRRQMTIGVGPTKEIQEY